MTDSSPPIPPEFTHLGQGADGQLESQMVDVGAKKPTQRRARARARVVFPTGVLGQVLAGGGPKGPIQEVARVAGIMAAKRTSEWIPMCHPLSLSHLEIRFEPVSDTVLDIQCTAQVEGATGVEMEAMVGASAAALTVYDMCKGVHKGIEVQSVALLEKWGGRSGHWQR